MPKTVIVIPCYREEERIDRARFIEFARENDAELLLVNDGSPDGTEAVLREIAAASEGGAKVISLPENRGKAEAVRAGLLQAMDEQAEIVGYLDADLSTPFPEMMRLLSELERTGARVILGARVSLLGRMVQRTWSRHYLGRVFASMASVILDLPVYDTQCGAKFFVADDALRAALDDPFLSRWAFDVELIGRLSSGVPGIPGLPREAFREVPLQEWKDVEGSKLTRAQMTGVIADLARIHLDLQRRRREAR